MGERGHVDSAAQLLHRGGVGGRASLAVLLVGDARREERARRRVCRDGLPAEGVQAVSRAGQVVT